MTGRYGEMLRAEKGCIMERNQQCPHCQAASKVAGVIITPIHDAMPPNYPASDSRAWPEIKCHKCNKKYRMTLDGKPVIGTFPN